MGLLELIDKELIRIPVESTSKNDLLEELVRMIDSNGKLNDFSLAYEDILKREALCSTGLERGIAVPHAKTAAVDKMVMAIGIAPNGIEFEALDGNPSSIFFMILAPPGMSGPHIEVLSDIAKVTKSNAFCRLLLAASDVDEVVELFEE